MEDILLIIKNITSSNDNASFGIIEAYIKHLLYIISISNNTIEINNLFVKLDAIQFELAKKVYINDILLTANLMQFVHDFDRIDDQEVRTYVMQQFRKGIYFNNK